MNSYSVDSRETDTSDAVGRKTWELVGAVAAGGDPVTTPVSTFPFHIGRARQNDLCVNSPVVSSRHAELLESSGLLFIRDTASTNGTWVNGHRVTHDTLLAPGDLIELGDTFFRVQMANRSSRGSDTVFLPGKTASLNLKPEGKGPLSLQMLLKDGNLLPCFQAIHCLTTGRIRGYEYLARCQYPGIESAPQLFEQARRAGREVELSLLCRERAMAFSSRLGPEMPVFLNTHPAESLPDTTVPQLRRLRDAYPERQIVLEIHEAAITEPAMIRSVRAALAEINVRLAFDDFGRGQARIRELICVRSDYIKFDADLIRDLTDISSEQFQFFRSIIQGIRREGALTIAEGVETEAMAQACREIGFDMVQGYLFSRPTLLTLEEDRTSRSRRRKDDTNPWFNMLTEICRS